MGREEVMPDGSSEWFCSRCLDLLPGLWSRYWGFGEMLDAVARSYFLVYHSEWADEEKKERLRDLCSLLSMRNAYQGTPPLFQQLGGTCTLASYRT